MTDPEELRGIARQLALMSPRRAPETPVLVHQDKQSGELRITLTPYERSESDALRLEVIRRLTLAFEGHKAEAEHSAMNDSTER